MPAIKRYPNRKLYDTEAKHYITLEGIAAFIRDGEKVSVIDHATGEDLTALVLTQIIVEQEKKRSGFLPQSVLTGLIKAGGDTISTLRRTLASPLNLARQVDEEIERRIQSLINQGEIAAEEGLRLRDRLLAHSHLLSGTPWFTDQELARVLAERGVPTRTDLQQVLEQLDIISDELDNISQRAESA